MMFKVISQQEAVGSLISTFSSLSNMNIIVLNVKIINFN